ncbi:hypothetical protein B7N59_21240 [Salmonella enterica subsp. enterica]|nr:hypothetical protein [Salmonella enterica]MIW33692.1 hypothetical protein [Salmonella enterica subsp. enterica serovar Derby]
MSNYISSTKDVSVRFSEKFSMSKTVDAKKDERADAAAHKDVQERYRQAGYKIDQNSKGEERYTKGDVIFIDRKDKIEFPDSQDKERLKLLVKASYDLVQRRHGINLTVEGTDTFQSAVADVVAEMNKAQGRVSRDAFEQPKETIRIPASMALAINKKGREELMRSYVKDGVDVEYVGEGAEKVNAELNKIKEKYHSSVDHVQQNSGMD